MSAVPELPHARPAVTQGRFPQIADRLRYPVAVYVASRVLYLMVAIADIFIRGYPLGRELRNWDGKWYVLLAEHGYPHTLPHVYGSGGWSTLGFEPLYSMLMWLGGAILPRGVEASGLLISLVCGGIATVEISVLAERWWGRTASRRGVVFFCFFPGTIVFSMVYSEGLALALIAGCLLCLEDRRWVWAGLLAGLSTAIEPIAFAAIPACAAVSARELWRHGWRDPEARRSLWAPILSPIGAIGTGVFLWFWTGTPLANYKAQQIAWGEKSSVVAVYLQARTFVNEFVRWHGWHDVNLNLLVGVIGAIFLVWGLWQLWQLRHGLAVPGYGDDASSAALLQGRGISLGAAVWTVCVSLLTVTSDQTPPNPRMLIVAFPVLMAVAAPRAGRSQKWLLGISVLLLIGMSIGSFAGGGLRP